ncbi:class I poly(R)-hydroxyalkanoic acid synthase [Hwanghaeella grinnelliae]|uniref:Class I poly(R)-hydroxyalkanoic acid synthase n=2 Tax=Hwanghaeella grinnelliae TaxID=2500179 RepID=A0A3S3USX4_9PROT|nr:class I poly(R)-hydroxyalkanoic acid synthase [Hwanghaeella grinnelliae]
MGQIAERSQKLVTDFLNKHPAGNTEGALGHGDPLNVGAAFLEMTHRMMTNPAAMMQAQVNLWQDYVNLWTATTHRMLGGESQPIIHPEKSDNRFRDEAWNENALFDYIKQSYLLTARWMQETVGEVEGLDAKTAKKVDFYTKQFADALAPSNFLLTNPAVLRETLDSKGENLIRGLENLLKDLEKGEGQLKISMTDAEAFAVGENIATSPGKVVFQTDLMQLIQYEPTTETVYKTPLVIVPPWINKYYILDLRAKNSFIKWAVDQGLTVFVVSWVNPDEKLARKTFEDYMKEGTLAAIDAVLGITGEPQTNIIGYCLGGTLTASTLAYMAAKKDERVKSATFFTTMIDFEEAGELSVFIDEEQLQALEERMNDRGYLEGSEMATTFNMLRANDLIWSFVVNNYLMGKDPFPFDLLYWNSDSTRMPAAMHSFYLRQMYLENKLIEPNGISLCDTPIDLTTIKIPVCVLSTREDHIAPWKSTYAATQTYKGPVKFLLAASGHIAGVVNPPNPEKPKYSHWTNTKNPSTPEEWLDTATEHPGSWWPEWLKWIKKQSGQKKTAPRIPGSEKKYPAIEAAPGSYVKARIE